ncbi:hypothetical protein MM742_004532 [Salmonella enterica]|nr:hypothetical protein [Salmonella enterica]
MQHKRSANDGVSLAAIVAKETKKGTWSGTGGGVGLGFGGPGVFLGGMSGSKSEQTKRASDFDAPAEAAFNWNYVLAPFYVMVAIAILIKFFGGAVELFRDTGFSPGPGDVRNPLSNASDFFSSCLSGLVYIVPIILFIGIGIFFFFFAGKRTQQEETRYLTEKQLDNAKELIYYRLRYVEQDHIVFDPVSGDEVPATKKHIHQLLHRLALDRVKRDNSR